MLHTEFRVAFAPVPELGALVGDLLVVRVDREGEPIQRVGLGPAHPPAQVGVGWPKYHPDYPALPPEAQEREALLAEVRGFPPSGTIEAAEALVSKIDAWVAVHGVPIQGRDMLVPRARLVHG